MTDDLHRRLVGIVPSQNTPFDAAGRVDLEAVARLAEASLSAGVAGMLVNAVASENRSLSIGEREAIARTYVETVRGRVPIVLAVSAPGIDEAEALARQAARVGADAICWQAPTGASPERLNAEIDRLTASFGGLFMLQDLEFGGPGLAIDTIATLYDRHPAFRAIKVETVPAGPKYSALLSRFGDDLHVSGGWAVMQMMDALERGVHAFVPTSMDHIYVRIHRLFADGHREEAEALFEQFLPVVAFSNQHIDVSIRFFKLIRKMQGIFGTDACRPPTAPLDGVQRRHAERLAARAITLDEASASV